LIGTLIAPIIYVDLISPEQDFFTIFIIVFILSLRGVYSFTYEGNLVEVIVMGLLYFVVMIIITPIIYALSFIFSALGGFIGKFLRDTMRKPKTAAQPHTDVSSNLQ
jgi:hypothetical protein